MWKKIILVGGVLLVGVALLLVVRSTSASLDATQVRVWLAELGPLGPVALLASLAGVLVIPIIPASILQIGAGLAFGPAFGLLVASLADIAGASIGFWLARRWGDTVVMRRLSPAWQAQLKRLTQRMNWRTVMLLRLLPGPAYPLVSFAAGASPLNFWHYTLASFVGVFPALALLVFAGDLVTSSPLLAFGLVVVLVGSLALAGRLIGGASTADEPAEGQA